MTIIDSVDIHFGLVTCICSLANDDETKHQFQRKTCNDMEEMRTGYILHDDARLVRIRERFENSVTFLGGI